MEFLNNIWNILTTENETLTMIITFPLMFVEIYLSFCLFSNILNIKYEKREMLTIININK